MAETTIGKKWFYRLLFVLISTVILFFHLIPLQTTPGSWAMPNLIICFCYAWVLRRDDYLPIVLIALIMLLADFLFLRPPGLMAALFVLGAEFLRSRRLILRELPFLLEWVMVAGVLSAVLLVNRFVLIAVLQPRPSLWLSLTEFATTFLAYPVVVLISRYLLGVRKLAVGEVDALGHRL